MRTNNFLDQVSNTDYNIELQIEKKIHTASVIILWILCKLKNTFSHYHITWKIYKYLFPSMS